MGTTHLSGLAVAGVPTLGMSGIPATSGNVFFVNSVTGSDGNIGSASFPYATTAAAYAACLADNGDIVVLTAGHAETVSAAGGITLAKSGVTIWGLGAGADRPTYTFSTSTAATVLITGANTSINNIVGICNIDQLVSPFVVQAADVTLNIEWHDGAANKEALRAILTSAAATRMNISLIYIGFTAGTHGVNAVRLVGVNTANIYVDYYGILTTAVIEFVTTACVNIQIIAGSLFYVSGTTNFSKDVVDTVGGSTWSVQGYDAAAGAVINGGSAGAITNNSVSLVATQQETGVVSTNTGVMVNAATIFTVAGGPIMITGLCSICQTANNATASTLQYEGISTLGALTGTFSGASATLASAVIGTTVTLLGTALATAPAINTTGVGLMTITPILVEAGTINIVIGAGSTTGTWKHYLRYKPMQAGVTVS